MYIDSPTQGSYRLVERSNLVKRKESLRFYFYKLFAGLKNQNQL